MKVKYSGPAEQLEYLLCEIDREGLWIDQIDHYMFIGTCLGGTLTWYPERGSIVFGNLCRSDAHLELEVRQRVSALGRDWWKRKIPAGPYFRDQEDSEDTLYYLEEPKKCNRRRRVRARKR